MCQIYGLGPEFDAHEIAHAKIGGVSVAILMAFFLSPDTIADYVSLGAFVSEVWVFHYLVPVCVALFSISFPSIVYQTVLVEFFKKSK